MIEPIPGLIVPPGQLPLHIEILVPKLNEVIQALNAHLETCELHPRPDEEDMTPEEASSHVKQVTGANDAQKGCPEWIDQWLEEEAIVGRILRNHMDNRTNELHPREKEEGFWSKGKREITEDLQEWVNAKVKEGPEPKD